MKIKSLLNSLLFAVQPVLFMSNLAHGSLASNLSFAMNNDQSNNQLLQPVLKHRYFKDFSHIMGRLHQGVEQDTDIFFIVNTAARSNSCGTNLETLNLPPQHLIMVERISRNEPVFRREQGQIVGLNMRNVRVFGKSTRALDQYQSTPSTPRDALNQKLRQDREIFLRNSGMMNPSDLNVNPVTPFVPISSGVAGGGKILTYSGLFRVNEERTNSRRNNTNTLADPMQFSIYIDGEYDEGREAAVALHGTTPNHWSKLGQQRASSGCIRVHTDFSEWARYYLFYRSSDSSERNFQDLLLNPSRSKSELVPRSELVSSVPSWNRRDHYPPRSEDYSRLNSRESRLRVLFVFYDEDNERSCI